MLTDICDIINICSHIWFIPYYTIGQMLSFKNHLPLAVLGKNYCYPFEIN